MQKTPAKQFEKFQHNNNIAIPLSCFLMSTLVRSNPKLLKITSHMQQRK